MTENRLYLDENFSHRLADAFGSLRCDVTTARERPLDNRRVRVYQQLLIATREQRFFVTHDVDNFQDLHLLLDFVSTTPIADRLFDWHPDDGWSETHHWVRD